MGFVEVSPAAWAVSLAALLLGLLAGAVGWARRAAARERALGRSWDEARQVLEGRVAAADRRHAEVERDQRLRCEELLQMAGIGGFEWELESGRLRWSGAWPALLGYGLKAADERFDGWLRLCKPQDLSRVQGELQAHISGRSQRLQTELRMRDAHGDWRWLALRAQATAWAADGRPLRVQGTVANIDAWRGAEGALQALHRLFASGPMVLFTLEAAEPHGVRWASAPLPGLPAARPAPGQPLLRLHDDDRSAFREAVGAALGHPGRVAEAGVRLRGESGGWQHGRLRLLSCGSRDEGVLHASWMPAEPPRAALPTVALQEVVQQMGATQRFLQDLQRMSGLLQQCEDEEAGRQIVAQAAAELFPGWDGALSLAGTRGHLDVVAKWGRMEWPEGFETGDCWALRRQRTHTVRADPRPLVSRGEGLGHGPACAHFGDAAPGRPGGALLTVCLPIAVDGQRGALHLATRQGMDDDALRAVVWGAETLVDALQLSLANLRLRISLREQAVRDWMTGLYNRRWFDEALQRETRRAERSGDSVTLAMLDIDHFKAFNDNYGHEAGDEVIKAVARQLLAFVRSYDIACRVGGEELAVLMPRASLEDTRGRLDRLREQIAEMRISHDGRPLPGVTVSIGIADSSQRSNDDLLRRADTALFAAKRAGRNRIFAWNPSLDMDSVFGTLDPDQPVMVAPSSRATH